VGAAWAGVIVAAQVAVLGAIWRVGNKLGTLAASVECVTQRLDRVQVHQEDHDQWHMSRLRQGKDDI